MYRRLIRPFLFLWDVESIHLLTFSILSFLLKFQGIRTLLQNKYVVQSPKLERVVCGITFPNPVGLAAGFDKDAKIGVEWKNMGFGFIEIGTITPRPQPGNPRKRLFRLPKDEGIINRMGFNNEGVEAAVERLKKMERRGVILGANIGKNKDTPNEKAAHDYLICFEKLFHYVDYFVVNVSSPNTPGLRELQEKEPLTKLLKQLTDKNNHFAKPKPIFLKIAPDLTESQLDDIIEVVKTSGIQGIIATNTTIERTGLRTDVHTLEKIGAGGLSGSPLKQKSTDVIRYLHYKSKGTFPIIGVGGIMTPEDAEEKLNAGASLIQLYTGFVYQGPSLVYKILKVLK